MRRVFSRSLLAAAICLGLPVFVGAVQQEAASASKAIFARPVILRGTLGEAQMQASLRAKAEMDGIEGEYFVFGGPGTVLLAGEIEGEDVFLEESENGTDVSGQWDGKLAGDTITGEWQSADGKTKKPFSLKIVRSADKARPKQQ
jgi:hypothetical protein